MQTDTYNAANIASEGGAKSYTAGIKWILNPNMRVMMNYTYTKFDYAFTPIDIAGGTRNSIDDEKIVAVRTQFMF
jgi:phosphate-selective porin OprO/OprP